MLELKIIMVALVKFMKILIISIINALIIIIFNSPYFKLKFIVMIVSMLMIIIK